MDLSALPLAALSPALETALTYLAYVLIAVVAAPFVIWALVLIGMFVAALCGVPVSVRRRR